MNSAKLDFAGTPGRDVYNICAPFQWNGREVIAGRVEKRDEELSEIVLFAESGGTWHPLNDAPTFPGLQDPCITMIDGHHVLGGVRYPVSFGEDTRAWQMEFYQLRANSGSRKVLTGPAKMKDIRFLQLPDRRIVVLTRPQGERGGRGKIGYFVVDSLEDAPPEAIENAPLLDQCPPEQWVGANEAHVLSNGKVGVLGHIASFSDDGHRHYHSMVFAIDLETEESTPPEVIATRSDFPPGESKRPDLVDVIFSGGIRRLENGKAKLYAGLSDAEAGFVEIPDPFLQYES